MGCEKRYEIAMHDRSFAALDTAGFLSRHVQKCFIIKGRTAKTDHEAYNFIFVCSNSEGIITGETTKNRLV